MLEKGMGVFVSVEDRGNFGCIRVLPDNSGPLQQFRCYHESSISRRNLWKTAFIIWASHAVRKSFIKVFVKFLNQENAFDDNSEFWVHLLCRKSTENSLGPYRKKKKKNTEHNVAFKLEFNGCCFRILCQSEDDTRPGILNLFIVSDFRVSLEYISPSALPGNNRISMHIRARDFLPHTGKESLGRIHDPNERENLRHGNVHQFAAGLLVQLHHSLSLLNKSNWISM